MSDDGNEREEHNQTATFNALQPSEEKEKQIIPLSVIQEKDEETNLQEQSIVMPRSLIQNSQIQNDEKQFLPRENNSTAKGNNAERKKMNLTFHPERTQISLPFQNSLGAAQMENQKLKNHMIWLNQTISEMVERKNEVLNEFENIVKQKKIYKKIIKNLNEEYEDYQTMLQGNYQLKFDEELERQAKKCMQRKKQVQLLSGQLSKPLVKEQYDSEERLQRVERQFYQTQAFLQKQKVLVERKRQRLQSLLVNIKQKQVPIKKMEIKIGKYQQQCEDEQLLPKQQQYALRQKYEEYMEKINRFRKVIELNTKKGQLDYQRKLKQLAEKDIVIKNMERQTISFSTKIQQQTVELAQSEQKKKKKGKLNKIDKISVPDLDKNQIESRYVALSRDRYSKTPKTNEDMVGNKFQRFDEKLHASNGYTSPHNAQPNRNGHFRTMTEGNEGDSRFELNLRKRRIYTELQKNMYFKNIQNSQHEKLSRIVESSDKDYLPLPESLQKQNARKLRVKLPEIQRQSVRNKQLESQVIKNESIIDQANFISLVEQRKNRKKSIEVHNNYIRQLRLNKKKLNVANYEQLCKSLKRDKLLIEEDCEYQLSDLIYNSRF